MVVVVEVLPAVVVAVLVAVAVVAVVVGAVRTLLNLKSPHSILTGPPASA